MPFKGVLSLVLPCLSILRLLLPRCIEQGGSRQQDFFLSFEVTFSFSPSQILHPVHKPCFKVRTQKLSHFGIKLSKILKNGRVAAAALAAFLRFSLREIMTAKKVSQFFFLLCSKDCCIICGKFFDGGFFGLSEVLLPVLLENCRVAALFMGR